MSEFPAIVILLKVLVVLSVFRILSILSASSRLLAASRPVLFCSLSKDYKVVAVVERLE